MKLNTKSFIIGIVIGLILGAWGGKIGIDTYNKNKAPSDAELKREAIHTAHSFVKARSIFKDKQLKFQPAVQKTKVSPTDLDTYVVEFRTNFSPGIWTKVPGKSGSYEISSYDWVIECKWNGKKMEVIESDKDFIFYY